MFGQRLRLNTIIARVLRVVDQIDPVPLYSRPTSTSPERFADQTTLLFDHLTSIHRFRFDSEYP